MAITYGTCYFVSKSAAIRYYSDYRVSHESSLTHGASWMEARQESLNRYVENKLREKEIKIGKPPVGPGESLSLDSDGRWHITEAEEHDELQSV